MQEKIKRIKRISILFIIGFLGLIGGKGFSLSAAPYFIHGEILTAQNEDITNVRFSASFNNMAQKEVSSFTVVFFVMDEDGGSPLAGRNNVVLKIDELVACGSSLEFERGMEKYFSSSAIEGATENSEFEVEYLYVSKIDYSDGTQWTDPLGLEVF